MGFFRFRRSIKILPGVRWNIGKKSSSLSFGGRGFHYTVGSGGSRTTAGIPGTGLSYTDIHHSHARVSGHKSFSDVPPPSSEWLAANMPSVRFHFPERQPEEPPATQDQLREIQDTGQIGSDFDWNTLGRDQAVNLLAQMKEAKSKCSKKILRRYYREQGASVPNWFIDHVVDHPNDPLPGTPRKGHGCLILLGIFVLIGWLSSLAHKQEPPSASSPVVSPPSNSLSLGRNTAPAGPTPSFNRAPSQHLGSSPSSNSQLPAPNFWPKQVRISAPVVLSGTVGGGTIRQTAKPGAVLDATLSGDHKTVILRRLDITGTLPIGDTDFLERARKSEAEK